MDWTLAQDDAYYQARALEARARKDGRPGLWTEFGEAKARKGSYALAALGHLNAAILQEGAGEKERAAVSYERAYEAGRKGGCELALVVAHRWAQLLERAGEREAAAAVHEKLGAFCEERGALFLAADAYEHAAELLQGAGRDVSGYSKPLELWERNARHWEERGHPEDARWSRRHAELFKALVR